MQKGKNVIGKDVVSFIDGKKVHSVKDLIIGLDNRGIVALLVDEGGLFSSSRVVPMENVVSYGRDAVVISDSNAALPAESFPEVQAVLDRKDKLVGKRVMTEGGDEHGKIDDIYFEEGTGEIVGYAVSEGFFKDVATGEGYLAPEDIVNIGADVVLIKSEAVYSLDAQTGGMKATLENAKEKVGHTVETFGSSPSGSTQQHYMGNPEQAAVGRRAQKTIEAEDGSLIVASGQRVTEREIEKARKRGMLEHLLVSTGVKQPEEGSGIDLDAAGQKVGDTLGQAGDKAGQVAGAAADKTGEVWDDFLAKVREWKDSAGERVDEEKTKRKLDAIQNAIGRPVSKVILDRQDNVILNLGDLITHESVQRAFDAGMLDTLLANVYEGDVTFTQEQMRAPLEGEATVEKASGNAQVVDELEQKVDQAEQEREQKRMQGRQEAEQKREENQQERDRKKQERDQKSNQDSGDEPPAVRVGASKQSEGVKGADSGGTIVGAASEPHEQASIPDDQFERGAKSEDATR